ncbi:glycoside hydrolase [Aspergillus granulosus]|uniref:Glycoside hydrolase n=1 Tax=Aspergillus granulosus TaxID=176169 RepID=A0ABR4HG51_9EURO
MKNSPHFDLYSSSIFGITATLFLLPPCLQAKAVFAHFMMSNTANYTLSTWRADISAAKAAKIDAFALNTGFGMRYTSESLSDSFIAAEELDFKLFLSLDYANSTSDSENNRTARWPQNEVVELLNQYISHKAYFRHESKPLVSTFEGFEAAEDWTGIKQDVNEEIIFIPDWTSAGPERASNVSSIDGLMSWNAWPKGTKVMDTTDDDAYRIILDSRGKDKLYIMPVSPWFYTNLPQFNKNWVWRGDDLWYARWQQALNLDPQPDFMEIISWNNYGESHYIGPLHEDEVGTEILKTAGAPFDYVDEMPHDGWRVLLPFLIKQYKAGGGEQGKNVDIEEEVLSVWYRLSPAKACENGNTTGNTEDLHQTLLDPGVVLEDKVFYSALLEDGADVSVVIGGDIGPGAGWTNIPESGRGVYHGSSGMGDREGEVVVTLSRNGETFAEMRGRNIELQKECPLNKTNWNAWVGVGNATVKTRQNGTGGPALPLKGWMVMGMVLAVRLFAGF